MIMQDDDPRAFWQTLAMGRVAGVNLSAAVVDGWLARSEFSRLVACCAACARADECNHFLAQPLPWPRPLPAFCANAAELSALATG